MCLYCYSNNFVGGVAVVEVAVVDLATVMGSEGTKTVVVLAVAEASAAPHSAATRQP